MGFRKRVKERLAIFICQASRVYQEHRFQRGAAMRWWHCIRRAAGGQRRNIKATRLKTRGRKSTISDENTMPIAIRMIYCVHRSTVSIPYFCEIITYHQRPERRENFAMRTLELENCEDDNVFKFRISYRPHGPMTANESLRALTMIQFLEPDGSAMRHLLSSLHWRRRVREAGRRSSPRRRRLFFHRATKTAGAESTSLELITNSLERCHRTRSDDSEIKSKKMNNLYKRMQKHQLDFYQGLDCNTNNTKEVYVRKINENRRVVIALQGFPYTRGFELIRAGPPREYTYARMCVYACVCVHSSKRRKKNSGLSLSKKSMWADYMFGANPSSVMIVSNRLDKKLTSNVTSMKFIKTANPSNVRYTYEQEGTLKIQISTACHSATISQSCSAAASVAHASQIEAEIRSRQSFPIKSYTCTPRHSERTRAAGGGWIEQNLITMEDVGRLENGLSRTIYSYAYMLYMVRVRLGARRHSRYIPHTRAVVAAAMVQASTRLPVKQCSSSSRCTRLHIHTYPRKTKSKRREKQKLAKKTKRPVSNEKNKEKQLHSATHALHRPKQTTTTGRKCGPRETSLWRVACVTIFKRGLKARCVKRAKRDEKEDSSGARSKCLRDASTEPIVKKFNYPVEKHKITTEDGYRLLAYRIPGHKVNPSKEKKTPVLLIPGAFCISTQWIVRGPGIDLAYLLADEGYDVWMSNNRGTGLARAHVSLDPDYDAEYWNFSWHEMGVYDHPANIDYILNATGKEAVIYIGHSMGTTSSYVLLSTRPEYNDKVALAISLAPVAYWYQPLHPIVNALKPLVNRIQNVYYLAKDIPNLETVEAVPDHKFTHLDFIFAKDVKTLLNDRLMQMMAKYST
ncbi:unnamed protein product [Trichogramma brassicae]|uniref:AB hydrolase-1 domain-containing protein n=1 Tax=Trichogramma brassicae TaxID=86971 RepID=A0A6H5I7L5_9HYME|nr:unnamed protein product [Trichogramma brassicae]